jgi:type I restriction enzyme S subunit
MALVPDVPLTSRTTFQKSVAILKPNPEVVLPQWLYYAIQGNLESLIGFAGGTAQKNLLLRDLRAFEIELPPLDVQRRIAGILSAYDDLIENNTRRIKLLEHAAHDLYREWFVEFRFPGHESVELVDSGTEFGAIPHGWEVKRLGDLAQEKRNTVKPDSLDSETPYVGLEHIPRKSIALSEWGSAKDVNSLKLVFSKGDILFAKIRPYLHKVAVAPIDGVSSSDAIVITSKQRECYGQVLMCTSSDAFVEYAATTSQGTQMPRANWSVLADYPIVQPPSEISAEFSEVVLDKVSSIHNHIFRNTALRETRDLLLPRLVSGELDVSDLDIQIGAES